MARAPNATTPAADGSTAPKAKRVIGPRTVFLIFKEGTDPALVTQMKGAVAEVTMNGRALLRALTGGQQAPFLQYKVEVEARGGDAPVTPTA